MLSYLVLLEMSNLIFYYIFGSENKVYIKSLGMWRRECTCAGKTLEEVSSSKLPQPSAEQKLRSENIFPGDPVAGHTCA